MESDVDTQNSVRAIIRTFRHLLDGSTIYASKGDDEYTNTVVTLYMTFVGADDAELGGDSVYCAVRACSDSVRECGYRLRLSGLNATHVIDRIDDGIMENATHPKEEYAKLRKIGVATNGSEYCEAQTSYRKVVDVISDMGLFRTSLLASNVDRM